LSITQLRKLTEGRAESQSIRDTAAQDSQASPQAARRRRRLLWITTGAGALLLILSLAWAVHGWGRSSHVISAERMRAVTVSRGHFVRDVAAEGTVIAAVNPTLYAAAPGTVSYLVRAGDRVSRGTVLAQLDSPELSNEYQRERATLDSVNTALAHQQIEIRKALLASQQQADLAQVAIKAAERELKRSQAAWDLRVIPERDYQRAMDDVDTARLNFAHARQSAALERDSLELDLKTRRLERDRQALVVADLKRRVGDLAVRSPVEGMVGSLAVTNKSHVAENAPLLTVVDLTVFEIEFQVPESFASEVKAGMSAEITLAGKMERGLVTGISPEVRDGQVTGRVRFAAGQPPGLRQNERASVRIVMDERDNVLKLERGSLIDEATRFVYVLRGDRAVRVAVQLGAASVGEIEVLRGLTAGDQVVVSDMRDYADAPEVLVGH